MKVTLNQHFVNTISCTEGKSQERFYDTVITGFLLEVRSSGSKSFCLRFRDQHNRQRQLLLGSAKDLSFEKARRAAEKARSKVVLGQNPAEEKNVKRKIPTFAEFATDAYIPYIEGYKRPESIKGDRSLLRNHLLKQFGNHRLNEITQKSIIEFHHTLHSNGLAKSTANRALVLLKFMLNLSIKWDLGITNNPAADIKLFEANNNKERFLTVEETKRLLEAVKSSKNTQLKYIVPLLLYLGCRRSELIYSKWEEFDLDRRIWRIPMSKSGKSRHVPLSKAALNILNKLPRWEGCPYVVPNPDTLKPFVQIHKAWNNVRVAAGLPDVRMHDLRHSMASNMVNSGRSIYEVAKVLGHSQLKTTQRYAHLSQETLLEAVDAAAKATGTDWGCAHME